MFFIVNFIRIPLEKIVNHGGHGGHGGKARAKEETRVKSFNWRMFRQI
jgi:hypothetical protein